MSVFCTGRDIIKAQESLSNIKADLSSGIELSDVDMDRLMQSIAGSGFGGLLVGKEPVVVLEYQDIFKRQDEAPVL